MSYFGYSACAAFGRDVFALDSLERRTHLAAGAVDTSFGTNGRVLGESSLEWVGLSQPLSADVAIDSSNRTVVVGDAIADSGRRVIFVARFNRDGSLDNTFDRDGLKLIDFGGRNNLASALSIDAAGRIVVGATAGNRREQFAVARLRADGALDSSFSSDGMAAIDFGANAKLNDIAVDSGNRIVFAGDAATGAGNSSIAVARMNPSGRLDTTFDTDGKRLIDASAGRDSAAAVVLTSNRIFIGGATTDASANFAALKLKFDGSLDRSFDGNGVAAVEFDGMEDVATSIAIDPAGRIVLGGYAERQATQASETAVARLNANGRLDGTFSTDGRVSQNELLPDRLDALFKSDFSDMLRARPQLLTSGNGYRVFSGAVELRIVENGTADTAFGWSGYRPIASDEAISESRGLTFVRSVVATNDGIAVAVNFDNGGTNSGDFPVGQAMGTRVNRVTPSGTVDDEVDRHRFLAFASAFSAEVGADGRLLLDGSFGSGSLIQAYGTNSRLDSSFGGRGFIFDFDLDNAFGSWSVFPQGDGAFYTRYTGRQSRDGDPIAAVIQKRNADGSAATGFGGFDTFDESGLTQIGQLPRGNLSLTYRSTGFAGDRTVLVRPDGTFEIALVVGASQGDPDAIVQIAPILGNSGYYVAGNRLEMINPNTSANTRVLQRQNADGTLDTSFAGDGNLSNFTGDIFFGQASGKLLYTLNGETGLRRLNLDGTPDNTFGINGVAASGYTNFDIDSQGRLIAFREIRSGAADGDVQVLRLTINGKTDTTFGGGDGLTVVDTRLSSAGTPNLLITPADDIVVTSYEKTQSGVKWSATRLLGA